MAPDNLKNGYQCLKKVLLDLEDPKKIILYTALTYQYDTRDLGHNIQAVIDFPTSQYEPLNFAGFDGEIIAHSNHVAIDGPRFGTLEMSPSNINYMPSAEPSTNLN
jgi:hypothetical protein